MNLLTHLNDIYLLCGIIGGGGALGLVGVLAHEAAKLARRDLTAAEAQIADLAEAGRIRADLMQVQKTKLAEQSLRISVQSSRIAALESEVAELRGQIKELLARLGEQVLSATPQRQSPRHARYTKG
jgi:hypothetical protein